MQFLARDLTCNVYWVRQNVGLSGRALLFRQARFFFCGAGDFHWRRVKTEWFIGWPSFPRFATRIVLSATENVHLVTFLRPATCNCQIWKASWHSTCKSERFFYCFEGEPFHDATCPYQSRDPLFMHVVFYVAWRTAGLFHCVEIV